MKKVAKIITLLSLFTLSSCSITDSPKNTTTPSNPINTSSPTTSTELTGPSTPPISSSATDSISKPSSPSSPDISTAPSSSSSTTPSKPSTPPVQPGSDYVPIPNSNNRLVVHKSAVSYYSSVNFALPKKDLKTSLSKKISSNFNSISYDGLWSAFKDTDFVNGKILDMYSDITCNSPQCGSYSSEGDCYNREHSVPKSWFGQAKPAYSDLFHLYPTDGKVNGMRSNYAFGEVVNATYTSHNGSKLGSADTSFGYSGKVFEPIDEYKGDFARTYFYFVTRYEGLNTTSGDGRVHFESGNGYPGLTKYSLKLFAKWHKEDPVSEKEIARNEVIYTKYQHNRNPFIDIPDLPNYLWEGLM